MDRGKVRRHASVLFLAAATSIVPAALQSSAAAAPSDAYSRGQSFANVSVITTKDFRVAVVAQRTSGSPPTAEVRVGFARRVSGRWRELGERRLDETYFWYTVTGARAVCRLELETVAPGQLSFRPAVTVRVLRSPSLGCGNTYRIPLVSR